MYDVTVLFHTPPFVFVFKKELYFFLKPVGKQLFFKIVHIFIGRFIVYYIKNLLLTGISFQPYTTVMPGPVSI